jgi:hypothetical protein
MGASAADLSPRALARLTGLLYLYIMVAAMFAEAFVRARLIVSGDAATTVRNIAASQSLWRWGLAADVSTTLCDVGVAVLLYILLRPVSRAGSIGAASLRIAYSAAMAAGAVFLIGPLLLLGPAFAASRSASSEIQTLALYSLRLHDAGFTVALVLFGAHLMVAGTLIARSTFFPPVLGVALAFAGACYFANSFIGFIAPVLASSLFPWILLPGFLAEGALTLWLLIVGVDPERWFAAQAAAGA